MRDVAAGGHGGCATGRVQPAGTGLEPAAVAASAARESGYRLPRPRRAVLRHAGGVRIDHVIGLFRLWWVPEGQPPSEGTYVRYDHEALIGILALEADEPAPSWSARTSGWWSRRRGIT